MARIFGQFELLENIGSGSLAELFKARAIHEPEKPPLVVKRIRPEFRYDTNLMARFVEGAQMVVGLEHPNIAAVYDAGVVQGRYFAALEYIAGKDLRHIQSKFETTRRALPVPVAMYLMTEVCKGLAFLHSARGADDVALHLVHADVSPQNVMVSFAGAVKLINVEGAWFRQKGWAPQRGKIAYLSPEQASGEDATPRSDIFSAGILFWEILTGKRLFPGDDDQETRRLVVESEIIPPADANRMVPADLSEIVLRALSRHPDARHPSMDAMYNELRRFAEQSRLTFSSKQIASWMRMTFPSEASKAPPERSPSEQVATVTPVARGTARMRRISDSVPGISEERAMAAAVPAEDLEEPDDATRIDPASQLLADLDHDGDGDPVEALLREDDAHSKATPPRGVPAVELDEHRSPTRETAQASGPSELLEATLGGEPTRTLRLDQAMRAHRRLEREVRTSEVQAVKGAVAVVTDDQPAAKAPPPLPLPPEPAPGVPRTGRVDERAAGALDEAMRSRRTLNKKLTEDVGAVRLRFERGGATTPSGAPAPDERKSMMVILLIVGGLLAVGLGVLAWMMLSADATQEEPTVQRAAEVRLLAQAPPGHSQGWRPPGPPPGAPPAAPRWRWRG